MHFAAHERSSAPMRRFAKHVEDKELTVYMTSNHLAPSLEQSAKMALDQILQRELMGSLADRDPLLVAHRQMEALLALSPRSQCP